MHMHSELLHFFVKQILPPLCYQVSPGFTWNLLPLQAYEANVICPNKHQSDPEKFYTNHLLESETYIGGHVECLESGVFRSDIPTSFKLDPSAYEVCNFFFCFMYCYS